MKTLLRASLLIAFTVMLTGCDKSFEGCQAAKASGITELNCGRIVVPIHSEANGQTYKAIFDDGNTDFTLFLLNYDKEKLRYEGVNVWIYYSGEKSRAEVKVLNYEDENGKMVLLHEPSIPVKE